MDGKQRVVDKTINALQAIVNALPSDFIHRKGSQAVGTLPMGKYKAGVAFWDLDMAVNQPLVWAEQQHILGILDGREEDYDLQTLTTVLAEAIGTQHIAQLIVPAGQVCYLNAVETVIPPSGGANIITANWRCSLWKDRVAVPSANGQAFHAADVDFGVGGGTQWDEFGVIPLLWAATNKPVALRLPGGTILTVTFTNTVAVAAAAVNCLFRVYGYIGKALVA